MPNLVGIGNSQVPTNAMLGGLAYQDPSNVNLESFEPGHISKIKAVIEQEASGPNTHISSIFVYDTRRDSDGGAWRHRTQHTSWYNEPLGTLWRGNRREFPEVAILVTCDSGFDSGHVQTIGFQIYDGDDPTCPMWMRFPITNYAQAANWGGGFPMIARPNFVSFRFGPIHALNGQIAMGNGHASGGSLPGFLVNMISEKCIDVCRYGVAANQFYWMSSNIASRVDYGTWSNRAFARGTTRYHNGDDATSGKKSEITGRMSSAPVFDIKMTVLSNNAIDPCTGLPQPTQFWATNGGMTVINGNTIPMTITTNQVGSYKSIGLSNLNHERGISVINQSGNVIRTDYYKPNEDGIYGQNDTSSYYYYNLASNSNPSIPWDPGSEKVKFIKGYENDPDDLAIANAVSLQILLGKNRDDSGGDTTATAATITHEMVTGYQPGDPHIALPGYCGTPGDVTGTVHYTDSFDATGLWSFADGASITGGVLRLSSTNGSRATRAASGFLVQGTEYYCVFYTNANSQNFQIDDDGSGAGLGSVTIYQDVTHNDPGYYGFTFTATAANRLRIMRTQGGGSNIDIPAMTIRPTEIQNKHNNYQDARPGFAIVGTLKREPVAPGAELCSYSGWSASNYITQGYNSALDWGTNNFMVSLWFKCPEGGSESTQNILGIGDYNHNDGFLIQAVNSSSKYVDVGYLGVSGNSFASTAGVQAGFVDQAWNHVFVHARNNTFHMWVNGKKNTFSGGTWTASNINWTTKWTKRQIVIGGRAGGISGNGAWASSTTKLALVRIAGGGSQASTDHPSNEEVRKIYEDEKAMFQPNAKVTIAGGTSYARQMEYDEKKHILHLGTNQGRSDFRRLVRINSTTEGVTTGISAYDGFIAEQ
tara:strand:+ start:2204 stop:4831 length:2628 start_codon:yes stop_codon:yes gene_type:complete